MIERVRRLLGRRRSNQPPPAPVPTRVEPLWLGAHPRSGLTWLRALVTHHVAASSRGENDWDAATVAREAPLDAAAPDAAAVATQSTERPPRAEAVYLVRDPRDVVTSQFIASRRSRESGADLELDAYVRAFVDGDLPARRWDAHVSAWIDRGDPPLIVRFEDVVRDPNRAAERVLALLHPDVAPAHAELAARQCTFAALRDRFADDPAAAAPLRSGRPRIWRGLLAPQHERMIVARFGHTMDRLGYA